MGTGTLLCTFWIGKVLTGIYLSFRVHMSVHASYRYWLSCCQLSIRVLHTRVGKFGEIGEGLLCFFLAPFTRSRDRQRQDRRAFSEELTQVCGWENRSLL